MRRRILLGWLLLLGAAAQQRAQVLAVEPRPGDLAGDVVSELRQRPLDAIESERRLTLAEAADLERRLKTLGEAQERGKARLRIRLRALYKLSQGGFARLLLGADSPHELYLRRRGARQIIGRDLEELHALRNELKEVAAEQAELQQQMLRLQHLDAEAAAARAQLHAGLDRPLAGLGELRGLLPRPVSPGSIVAPYGREVVDRGLEIFRHGAELAAEPGSPVRAVAAGQVRYAGELAGLGHGVIIEHAGGYLTLYGRVGRTSVVAGDEVSAGMVLGRALYPRVFFQLALGDIPLDPEPWLADRRSRQ
ncbi:MAG: M23 family metallopeptidase [Myxococcales bacterium]|nr:M23 family metallopeptidase [Myxococcota bacterium]MDW8283509.1 M23 family metallopeptidase [Myxococcales bacterium]